MTRKGGRRAVDAEHWRGRLDVAQAYLKVAEDALELADPGQNCIPIIGNIALGVIAYSDSLTAIGQTPAADTARHSHRKSEGLTPVISEAAVIPAVDFIKAGTLDDTSWFKQRITESAPGDLRPINA